MIVVAGQKNSLSPSLLLKLQLETQTPIEVNPDSIYKPIERPEPVKTKLVVPKKLEEALPYASKPKDERQRKKKGYLSKRAVIMDADERRKESFIQALNTIRKAKQAIRKSKKEERKTQAAKTNAQKEAKLEASRKARLKRKYRSDGKKEKAQSAKRAKT